MKRNLFCVIVIVSMLVGCNASSTISAPTGQSVLPYVTILNSTTSGATSASTSTSSGLGKIKHIIIIMQEN